MRPSARIKAAIDVLDDVVKRHRPASAALADWGKSNRYAGSGDRSAIGTLVFDALRKRASAAHAAGSDKPRGLVLGALMRAGGLGADEIAALCDGGQHGPAPLSDAERKALATAVTRPMSDAERGDVPAFALEQFSAVFGDGAVDEAAALSNRAPVDLRTNTLKTDRAQLLAGLEKYQALATTYSRLGVRLAPPEGGKRQANVEADVTHGKGWFEVQDEGSQIAAALTGVKAGDTVLDLCAGAGGKTLALAAAMDNKGQIHAYDDDKTRLRPIFERMTRAGVSNVDVISAGDESALAGLGNRFDCVLIDAPCTGSGTWRRKPDAKWRLKPDSIRKRQVEQRAALATGASHVKPGGRLVYVTCSLFPAENTEQVAAFLAKNSDFSLVPTAEAWAGASKGSLEAAAPASADGRSDSLVLTPLRHGTDGFFVAVMMRGQ